PTAIIADLHIRSAWKVQAKKLRLHALLHWPVLGIGVMALGILPRDCTRISPPNHRHNRDSVLYRHCLLYALSRIHNLFTAIYLNLDIAILMNRTIVKATG